MDQITHEVRLARWKEVIRQCQSRPEGQSIGARIVDVRWIGSFNYNSALRKRIIEKMESTHDIWFSMFWKEDGKTKYVRFCVHCEESYSSVRNKLFKGGIRDNGTYDPYVPKNDPLDVLIAGRHGIMKEKQCHENCPLYPEMCFDCVARYWCLCNSVKQMLTIRIPLEVLGGPIISFPLTTW